VLSWGRTQGRKKKGEESKKRWREILKNGKGDLKCSRQHEPWEKSDLTKEKRLKRMVAEILGG